MPRNIIIKHLMIKEKENIIWKQPEKLLNIYRRKNTNSNGSGFLVWNHGGQKDLAHFSSAKREKKNTTNIVSHKLSIWWNYLSGIKREIKTFSDKVKRRVFVTRTSTIKEWLKFLKQKGNDNVRRTKTFEKKEEQWNGKT